MRRSGSHRSRRRTRIRTVNQERTPQIAYMRGENAAESDCHGILSLRNPRNILQGERPTGLSLFVIPSFFRHTTMRITSATRARITLPTADARMSVTMFAFRSIIDNIGVRVAME